MVDEEEDITQICTKNQEQKRNRVSGCKLRIAPKILATAYCKADFHEKRNPQPLVCIRFSFSICATL